MDDLFTVEPVLILIRIALIDDVMHLRLIVHVDRRMRKHINLILYRIP